MFVHGLTFHLGVFTYPIAIGLLSVDEKPPLVTTPTRLWEPPSSSSGSRISHPSGDDFTDKAKNVYFKETRFCQI